MTLLDRNAAEIVRQRSIPVLATERLLLRAPRFEDAKAIAMLADDRRVAENTLRIPHPYRLADAESFIATANGAGDERVFAITDGAAVLGACGIAGLDGEQPEVGYWLGVAFWGQGYATEAVRAVIDHAFGELGCERLTGGARVSNPASRRVLEKCGFQWTGVGLYRIRAMASSAPVDRFRLDRGLWASLKSWGKATGAA
ncbi:MAG: GNAT family N-acetyltransferase [Xanthobacteraceae bacterium]